MIPHIPVVEIMRILVKLRRNQTFIRVGRIYSLSLIALSAIGCAGIWVDSMNGTELACTLPKWGCYAGPALTLPEFISVLHASNVLLLLPLFDLLSAFLFLFRVPRTYLVVLILSGVSAFIILSDAPYAHPYTNTATGSGQWLTEISSMLLFFSSLPLALAEDMRLNPNRDIFAGFMGEP